MVNHPGGEESGSGVLVFFQSDLQPPFPVQLDLKKVALFGISLTTTHFHPSPDPQQKYQPATEATPQKSLVTTYEITHRLCTTPLSSFLRPGRRNKKSVVALRDPATDPLARRHAAPKERSHTHAHTHAEPLQCGEAAFYQSRRASDRIHRRYHHGALSFLRTFFITCITHTSFFTID